MVHLHMRSAYTLLQSTVRIEESVAKAKEMGMSALALTDKNVMHGVPSFVRACQKFHIKPIIVWYLPGQTHTEKRHPQSEWIPQAHSPSLKYLL